MNGPVKLIPADPEQCQAEVRTGCFPTAREFMKIGPGRTSRCLGKPVTIATEVAPREDGQRGSMSLCKTCWAKFIEQMGAYHASFAPVPKK